MVRSTVEAGTFLTQTVNTNTQQNSTTKCHIAKRFSEQKEDFGTKSVNLIINSNNSNESNEIQGNIVQELNEQEPEKFNWNTVLRSMS